MNLDECNKFNKGDVVCLTSTNVITPPKKTTSADRLK